MSDDKEKADGGWLPVIFLLVVLPAAFTYGGLWIGLGTLVVGVVALGWSKRHNGPFPTNKG